MAITVKVSSAGIRALLKDPGLRSDLHRRAQQVADAAKANAPVVTGAYRDSIRVEDVTTDRAVAHVVADVWYALGVEAKTGNLARSLDAAG